MAEWNIDAIANGFQEAAIDPDAWTNVLDLVGDQVGARGALLLSSDHRVPGSPCSTSLKPMLNEYFRDGWNEQDPRFRAIPIALRKGVIVDQDFLSAEEVDTLPFYRGWLRRHKCLFFASVVVRSGTGLITLTIQRSISQGMFEPHEVKALTTMLKPLSDSVEISRQFGQRYVLGIADALQFTSNAAMLLDEGARVLEVNSLGAALLGQGIDVRQQRLHIEDRKSRDAVDLLIRRALSPLASSGDLHGITQVTINSGVPITIRAISLREWAKTTFTGASVMLLFEHASKANVTDEASFAKRYSLTPSELRVAIALGEGLSTAEAAKRLGIQYSTLRTHLKMVMHKTDTHKQGQLIALLSRHRR